MRNADASPKPGGGVARRLAKLLPAALLYPACAWAGPPQAAPLLFLGDSPSFTARAQGFTARFEPGGVRIGETIRVRWPGSQEDVPPRAEDPVAVRAFLGQDPSLWRTAGGANRVLYPALYPGIDLRYCGRGGQIKSEFTAAPGADPALVRIRYEGALSVRLEASGGLRIEARDGVWTEDAPFLYQEVDGALRPVEGAYEIHGGEVRFRIGDYDRTRPLVIDPALRYSGVFGGTGISAATAVAVGGGSIFVAGFTDAHNYPNASPLLARGGGVDGFLMQIDPATGRLISSTFVGGNGDDRIFGLCRDPSGRLYLTGWTTSPNFPLFAASQGALRGGRDAFVLQINPAGSALAFSTYFGGSGSEAAHAAACDASGVWIGGETNSTNLPVLAPWQASAQGQLDGFIARFSPAGALLSSTYAGGAGEDSVRALAADASGSIYAAGASTSSDMGFPSNSFQRTSRGGQDGFVLRLSAAGDSLLGGGFLGGTRGGLDGLEAVNAIALAAHGVFVGGQTASPDFPLLNPWRSAFHGASEGFLARLSLPLDGLQWSTFVGGAADDAINALALDASGGLIAAGRTNSPDAGPILPIQMGLAGGTDGLVLRTAGGESAPVFRSYLGGTGEDGILALAIDDGQRIVAVGQSGSSNYPVTGDTAVPSGSLTHAFVTEIASGEAAEPLSLSPAAGSGFSARFTLTLTHPAGFAEVGGGALLFHSAVRFTGGCRVRFLRSSGQLELASDDGQSWAAVAPGSAAQASNSACTLRGAASSVSQSDVFLNVTFDLEFAAAFGGVHGIYSSGWGRAGETSGFRLFGSWTVPAAATRAPAPFSVSTSAPDENVQVLTIQLRHPDGGTNLESALVLVQSTFTASQACFLWLDRGANRFFLADDVAANWVGVAFGSSGIVQNSQCLVRAASSTSETFGQTWMVRLELTFREAFRGPRRVWVQARDLAGNLSPWTELGQIQVAAPARRAPTITAVQPSSGRGSEQIFQVTASDPDGAVDLLSVLFLIHDSPSSSGGCLVLYDRPGARFLLADDRAVNWNAVRPGTADVARNGQCVLRGTGSAWTASGLTGTAALNLQFDPSFIGAKRLWAQAADTANLSSGLGNHGGYEVVSSAPLLAPPAAPPPAAHFPVTPIQPAAGRGVRQVFELAFPHDGRNRNSTRAIVLFSNAVRSGRACQVAVDPPTGRFYVADEEHRFWRHLDLGAAAGAGNSLCTLHGATSGWSFAGGTWRISLDLEFHPPLQGSNTIWLQATDGRALHFGPSAAGTYTVEPR
jgi:hypothetical protein